MMVLRALSRSWEREKNELEGGGAHTLGGGRDGLKMRFQRVRERERAGEGGALGLKTSESE
jgi:hypothetical protein